MRTTIDIDDVILKEIKALQKKQGKSLGRLVSDLLAQSLRAQKPRQSKQPGPAWIAKPMGARLNLADPETVYGAMESPISTQVNNDQ